MYVTSGAGFLVGCLRVLMKYPDNLPGFFKEVTDCHVDPHWALPTVLLSAISLGGGANLGPEQAMVRACLPCRGILATRISRADHEWEFAVVLTVLTGKPRRRPGAAGV